MPNLVLAPTYSVSVVLQVPGASLTFEQPSSSLTAAVTSALRGPAGYGLLGYEDVTPGDAIDISAPVGVYALELTADTPLSFTGLTAAVHRKRFIVEVTQGAGGGFTLQPDASVALGADLPSIDLSTNPGVTDCLGFIYRHNTGKCHFLGINHG